jgi:hydrogenase-4 component E
MSMENGLILAAIGVKGMPLVVEASVAFSVMIATFIFGVFFFHIRERFDSLDVSRLEEMQGERHP